MGEKNQEVAQAETPETAQHKNGKARVTIFRLIGYKGVAKRRGYWSSCRILLRNHKKYKNSKMEIFESGKWQSLGVNRAEQMAEIEEEAIAQRKAEKQKAKEEAEKSAKTQKHPPT